MFKIHTQTHRLISKKLYEHITDSYGIELNLESLMWGSIAPDILPKYKLYRHYYKNSIDYIIIRIAKLIFVHRFIDLYKCNYFTIKLFSREIGIISHYLADFTCMAHADNWELPKSLVKHLKYEIDLNEYSKNHEFEEIILSTSTLRVDYFDVFKEMSRIKLFIESVIFEYMEKHSFSQDLNYALALNKAVFEYIIESILDHNNQENLAYSY